MSSRFLMASFEIVFGSYLEVDCCAGRLSQSSDIKHYFFFWSPDIFFFSYSSNHTLERTRKNERRHKKMAIGMKVDD